MNRAMAASVIVLAVVCFARTETVQTRGGPVQCWTARPSAGGVACVTSNGVVTIP